MMNKEKDPTKQALHFIEAHSYRAPTSVQTRESVGKFVNKELARQKEEGIISEDADKINIAAAGYPKFKIWQWLFTAFAAGLIILLIVLSAVVCVYMADGRELPSYLSIFETFMPDIFGG